MEKRSDSEELILLSQNVSVDMKRHYSAFLVKKKKKIYRLMDGWLASKSLGMHLAFTPLIPSRGQ